MRMVGAEILPGVLRRVERPHEHAAAGMRRVAAVNPVQAAAAVCVRLLEDIKIRRGYVQGRLLRRLSNVSGSRGASVSSRTGFMTPPGGSVSPCG